MMRFLSIVWLTVIFFGQALLWNYEWRPGARLAGSDVWPAHSSLTPQSGAFNLVVCLHPQCPCSRATVDELYKIIKTARTAVHVHVLLFEPSNAPPAWATSPLLETVKAFPDTTVVPDPDGLQAALLGALTSGDVQLFSYNGQRLFHGGITVSRGHAGDNAGADAISEFLSGGRSSKVETPIFGCAIQPAQIQVVAK